MIHLITDVFFQVSISRRRISECSISKPYSTQHFTLTIIFPLPESSVQVNIWAIPLICRWHTYIYIYICIYMYTFMVCLMNPFMGSGQSARLCHRLAGLLLDRDTPTHGLIKRLARTNNWIIDQSVQGLFSHLSISRSRISVFPTSASKLAPREPIVMV